MRLSKSERDLLTTFSGIAQKLLGASKPNGNSGNGQRLRRPSADVGKMKKQIRAARKKKVPVKQIAEELGITTSYIYQLDR
jgi:hypothetical protein